MNADELHISLDTYYQITYKGKLFKESKHPLARNGTSRLIHHRDVAESVCNSYYVAMSSEEDYRCAIKEVQRYTIQNHWGIISTMYSQYSASIDSGAKKINKRNLTLAHHPFPLELIHNPYFKTLEEAEAIMERLKRHIKVVVELGLNKHWRAESEPWIKQTESVKNLKNSFRKNNAPKKPELTKSEYSQGLKSLGFLPVSLNPFPKNKVSETANTKKPKKPISKVTLRVKSVGRAKP